MKFDSGGGRDRWCDVNSTKQEILKVEREKPDDSTRQFFSPTHNLMPVRKIPFYRRPEVCSVSTAFRNCRRRLLFLWKEVLAMAPLRQTIGSNQPSQQAAIQESVAHGHSITW